MHQKIKFTEYIDPGYAYKEEFHRQKPDLDTLVRVPAPAPPNLNNESTNSSGN